MNKKNLTTILLVLIIIFAGATVYVITMRDNSKSVLSSSAEEEGLGEDRGWEKFSFNGGVLEFDYPEKFCYDTSDCRDLAVIKSEDTISLGQRQKESSTNSEFIEPIFSIYFSSGIGENEAEQYLKDKYELTSAIFWIADKEHPDIKTANLKELKITAAYSKEFQTLAAFQLHSACLFDCQIDQTFLQSIKLFGERIYQDD